MSADWISVAQSEALGARSSQQDCATKVFLPPENDGPDRLLVVLADGMGGHAAGDVASKIAVEAFITESQQHANAHANDVLQRGLQAAAQAVRTKAASDPALHDMGTTLVAGVIERAGERPIVRWISVGDSPLWRVNAKGAMERLNADHSLAGLLEKDVRDGRMTEKEAESDPRRNQPNVLTVALMAQELDLAKADHRAEPLELADGDLLLFSSDGAESLGEKKIGETVSRHRRDGAVVAAKKLVKAVIDRKAKHQDNVSVVVADPFAKPKRGLFG